MMMTQTPGLHGQQNALLDGTIDDMLLRRGDPIACGT